MKELQERYEMRLPAMHPFVLRLDGVAFRTFTAGMDKPFDARLTRAMLLTTRDLVGHSGARTGFCQSDEISLVFAPMPTAQYLYAGRVQKIVSVMTAFATARFNLHINKMNWNDTSTSVKERIADHAALFDGRIFSTPNDIMAAEALFWRHRYDGRRNAVSMIGYSKYASEELNHLSLAELIERLEVDYGIRPHRDYPLVNMYGCFMKKREFPHVGYNPKTGQTVPTVRARIEGRTFEWTDDGPTQGRMVLSSVWEPDHPTSLENIDLEYKYN
jgi:tRNA(His) 5'-end guanylyltransferase